MALVMAEHHLRERDACTLLDVARSTNRYEPRPDRNVKLREALRETADRHPRFGYAHLIRRTVRCKQARMVQRPDNPTPCRSDGFEDAALRHRKATGGKRYCSLTIRITG